MRKIMIAAAAAATTLSTPAFAEVGGQGRIEARAGIAWAGGNEEFIGGVAAGYDFDLGDTVFAGPEVSYDTDFDNIDIVNLGGRIGVKAGDKTRLYVGGAYDVGDTDEFNAGIGAQHHFSEQIFGKVEYRRFFLPGTDVNAAVVGVGVSF